MNRCFFTGRLTKDMEIRKSNSGKSVGNCTLAVNTGYGENQKAHFFNIVAFDKNADNIAQYFHKGDSICIEAEAQQNTWEDQQKVKHFDINFVVRGWEFFSTKKKEAEDDFPFA